MEKAARGRPDFWPEGARALEDFARDREATLTRKEFTGELRRLFHASFGPSGPSGHALDALDHFLGEADYSLVWEIAPHEPLPRVPNEVLRSALGEDAFVRIGGQPEWIQLPQTPVCPGCQRDMGLIAEIRSLPRDVRHRYPELARFHFSDSGRFYLFHCSACGNWDSAFQFY